MGYLKYRDYCYWCLREERVGLEVRERVLGLGLVEEGVDTGFGLNF